MANKQMDLFDEGGLMQEGGTVDPVSGNDVPIGSTQEEVRDDIPAQLSEGEFVMPADVVRYHGLDKMMALRDEAKMGLARMEAMGQMGNSEEAIIPDGVPFNMDDLDIDYDEGPMEMQVGGYVPNQQQPYGIYQQPPGYGTGTIPSQFSQYSQTIQPASQFQPFGGGQSQQTQGAQGYLPAFYNVPQMTGTQPGYTFGQLMPTVGGVSETREYRNEAGQVLYIPFVNGQPVYPIPEGYTEYTPEDISQPTDEVQQAVETTTVTDRGRDGLENTQASTVSSQQMSGITTNLGVTGSRGGNVAGLVTALGFIANPVGTAIGLAGSKALEALDIEVPSISEAIAELADVEPTAVEDLSPAQQAARAKAEQVTGTSLSGYVGTQTGDIDPVTGGVFGNSGIAIDTNTGFAAQTPQGTTSFGSVNAATNAAQAAIGSGYVGGLPSAAQFSALSPQGKANAANHISTLADITNDPSLSNSQTTQGAIATIFGDEASTVSPAQMAQAEQTLTNAMVNHMQEQNMFSALASPTEQAAAAQAMAGLTNPAQAMAEGVSVSDFSSPTAAAQAGIGYSSYGEDGQPTGAAPQGSQVSTTGSFSTPSDSVSGGSVSGSTGGEFGEGSHPGEEGGPSGGGGGDGGRVICTELHAQGLLNSDLYALDVEYTKTYISDTTIRGYHYWAIPLVKQMRKSNRITKVCKYFAELRANEIAHIMQPTKYTKTSLWGKVVKNVGETFCYGLGLFVNSTDWTSLYKKDVV